VVNRTAADDGFDSEVNGLTSGIVEAARLMVRVQRSRCGTWPQPRVTEPSGGRRPIEACVSSDDYVEGHPAFLEKRAPPAGRGALRRQPGVGPCRRHTFYGGR
jgi:hypothetical protein